MSTRPLLAAAAFLTRLPVPGRFDAADMGRATAYFPLVGAGVGFLSAVLAAGLAAVLPPRLAALLVVAAAAWLTGAIHLDGLADTADGLGGASREDALRIMREPTLGAFGVLALVLLVGCKVEALALLLERGHATASLLMAPALARWAAVLLAAWQPSARPAGEGLGGAVARRVRWHNVALATAFAAAAGTLAGRSAAACGALVLGLVVLAGVASRRRLGGITGDVLGAATEVCEAAVLVAAVALTR